MLEIRSTYAGNILRLAASGSLESADLPLINQVLTSRLRTVRAIRVLLGRLAAADPATFQVLRYQVVQVRLLGIDCSWVGPVAAVRAILEQLDELGHVRTPDEQDEQVLAEWPAAPE